MQSVCRFSVQSGFWIYLEPLVLISHHAAFQRDGLFLPAIAHPLSPLLYCCATVERQLTTTIMVYWV